MGNISSRTGLGLLYRPQPSSSESSSVGALFRAVVSTSPGSGWAPGMGCSGVLFHPRSTVAAGVGAGLLRSHRSAPPNDAGLAGEASRRRGPGGDIGGPDSLGFVAAGRPELGAGGFGRAHLGSPDDRLETSVVCARGREGGGERRGRRRSALYDPERTLATASSEPRREGRRGGAALPSEPRDRGRSDERRRTDRLSEERRSEGQSDEDRRSEEERRRLDDRRRASFCADGVCVPINFARIFFGRKRRGFFLATCYVSTLNDLNRFEEAKTLSRRSIPVARRTLGNSHLLTLQMRSNYAIGLCKDDGATLDDLREGVTTLEDAGRISRRVLGGAHPLTAGIDTVLRNARVVLRARETPHG